MKLRKSTVVEGGVTYQSKPASRPIPMMFILLLALAIHGPLLLMQLPAQHSYDTNFHIFFASHYAKHWFDPWNEKWFAGFSQTTYPPLGHQLIALFSYVIGLNMAYELVQLIAVLLVPIGVFRFAKLWVDEVSASYAAVGSVFIGSLSFLVYNAGQLSTTLSGPLYVNALPYLYYFARKGRMSDLIKGVFLSLSAACVHHVTLIFGAPLLALPTLYLAWMDAKDDPKEPSQTAVLARGAAFAAVVGIGVGIVLLPYWIQIIKHPIKQIPIPHASRSNLLTNLTYGTNYFIVPYGMMILAFPFMLMRGVQVRRLRPLLVGFWFALVFGLGGTTPLPRLLLGRAFDILTFERFTLLACMLGLPLVGNLAKDAIERYGRPAIIGLSSAAIATLAFALGWMTWTPYHTIGSLKVDAVANFLNRDGHDQYRYLTLGFGNALPKLSTYSDAPSIDGEYNSARLLPEMTSYGSAQLTSSKFFGTAGMDSLRAILKHANKYGLRFIFVHDPYYEPLLVFAGWHQIETYDGGAITAWSKDDVPPAHKFPSDAMPSPWEGLMWGILPISCAVMAAVSLILLPSGRRSPGVNLSPAREGLYPREAHR